MGVICGLQVCPEHLALGGGHHFFPNPRGGLGDTRHPSVSPKTCVTCVPLIVALSALWMVAWGASQKASLMMTLNT